jgi:hypothetical protein
MAAIALGYGWLVGGWPFFAVSGTILGGVLILFGSKWYVLLRQQVVGLDRIAWGLASFLVAAFISLWKAGLPQRWLTRFRPPRPEARSVAARQGP